MRTAHILPAALAEVCLEESDRYHLLIAPEVLANPQYREFYRERGLARDFVMLDNGAYEAHAYGQEVDLSPQYLESAVNALGFLPSEIVLPDVPKKAAETLMASAKAAYYLREAWPYSQFMGVPHGVTLEEYLECARYMSTLPGLNTFGVSFIAAETLGLERGALVLQLCEHVFAAYFKKHGYHLQIHLLGYKDPISAEVAEVCRGVDTAKHVRMALEGNALSVEAPTITCGPRPDDFFQMRPRNEEEVTLVKRNISAFKEIMDA